jgi:hypothetical protein
MLLVHCSVVVGQTKPASAVLWEVSGILTVLLSVRIQNACLQTDTTQLKKKIQLFFALNGQVYATEKDSTSTVHTKS